MANRIVLISDDTDFFDYIKSKLELRKSDELFTFAFDAVPDKIHLLETAVLIVNSENSRDKTLDLLSIFKETPVIVSAYNDDDTFRRKCYRAGMFDFLPLLTPVAEFRARMLPALSVAGILEKKLQYREILAKNNIINSDNDVFTDYNEILDNELHKIHSGAKKAVFIAIAPNEKSKFLLKTSLIEAVILNNTRKNDILMNYAANKYFLLMYDTDVASAQKVWEKISEQLPEKLYAGFVQVTNQKRQQVINEVLNKLHENINKDKNNINTKSSPLEGLNKLQENKSEYINFKMFKQDFAKKIEQVISPVFYQVQQKYSNTILGVSLEQGSGEGYGTFHLKSKFASSCFKITCPGFSKINIDITFQKGSNTVDAKRITLEPEELEAGLLEDLLEQFILDYKRSLENDS